MLRLTLKILKWIGFVLGGLVALVVLGVVVVYLVVGARANRTYEVEVAPIAIPTGPEAIARGEHISNTFGLCTMCHSDDLAGRILQDDPLFVRIVGGNLTSGKGGFGPAYSDADMVRAIRHGLDPDGKPLLIMPSTSFVGLSDEDIGNLIAYLRSLPPIDKEMPSTTAGPLGRLFVALGMVPGDLVFAAEVIDHSSPPPPAPEPGVTVEYGEYLSTNCVTCHGDDYGGRQITDGGPNITTAGAIKNWSEAEFKRTLRTGVTPDGRALDPDLMPWKNLGQLTDDELSAVWLFLNSLPPIEPGPK